MHSGSISTASMATFDIFFCCSRVGAAKQRGLAWEAMAQQDAEAGGTEQATGPPPQGRGAPQMGMEANHPQMRTRHEPVRCKEVFHAIVWLACLALVGYILN